jgi:diguanylate cyclase (GGDEF)-like protein
MQLDEPSGMSRSAVISWLSVAGIYLVLAGFIDSLSDNAVVSIPGVALAHSISMAILGLVTAIVLYAHAARAGNRGYLVLAGTFACVVVLVLAVPLAFPGAILIAADGTQERLLGGVQSSITLFYLWHLVMYAGLPISAIVINRAIGRGRSILSGLEIAASIIVPVGIGTLLACWALLAPDTLPVFIVDGEITGLARALDWLLIALATLGLVVIVLVTHERNVISRWITAVAVLSLGEAIVNFGVERYSIGWYFTRTFGLFAMSALLLALVWESARVDRVTLTVASRDSLTQVQSRAVFEANLGREVARAGISGESVALLWIDIDNFKAVNDRFGHSTGDLVLQAVAGRIQAQVRRTDLLARMGGDEFAAALISVHSPALAESVADRIVHELSLPIEADRASIFTSCSVGVAFAPLDATTAAGLLHKADVAMYEAKAMGGNRLLAYRGGLEERARATAELRSALIVGVQQGAFIPFAQPIVDLDSGRTIGFEVLARWQRDNGIAAAAEFIGLAEDSHLVLPIGRQVLEKTADVLPRLLARQPPLDFISINLSVHELRDDATMTMLSDPRWATFAPRIVIEITESAALDSSGPAQQSIHALQGLGYRFAVDDFGVGFSTIVRLEQLHPAILKADRSLLTHAAGPGAAPEAMLRWAADIAASQGCGLVVEGVETAQEDALVRSLGRVFGQGYFYGVPAPLESWLVG